MMTKRWVGVTALLSAALLAGGCGIFGPKEDKKISYQTKTSAPPSLEVPPDLSRPGTEDSLPVPDSARGSTYSGYTSKQQQAAVKPTTAVTLDSDKMRIVRAGTQRWLVVQGDPDGVWPNVRAFVLKNGLSIAVENRDSGVLETNWAENRETLNDDFIYRQLSKVFPNLYSAGQKDKFRIRLERGQAPGTTEIYLTHRGMTEVVAGETGTTLPTSTWQARKPDPELENEMLRLLMVHLGADEKNAKSLIAGGGGAERASLRRDVKGDSVLSIEDTLDRAWRRVGLTLDRVGFTVEDRDRSKGVYYVRYIDPSKETGESKGMFSWFIGGGDKKLDSRYQVSLAAAGAATEVSVLDSNGVRDKSKTGDRILNLLYEQLK